MWVGSYLSRNLFFSPWDVQFQVVLQSDFPLLVKVIHIVLLLPPGVPLPLTLVFKHAVFQFVPIHWAAFFYYVSVAEALLTLQFPWEREIRVRRSQICMLQVTFLAFPRTFVNRSILWLLGKWSLHLLSRVYLFVNLMLSANMEKNLKNEIYNYCSVTKVLAVGWNVVACCL